MRQAERQFIQTTEGRGFYEVTRVIADWAAETGMTTGLLTLLCRHTSAGLLITENAAPAVRRDLGCWLDRIAPEGSHYEHDDEGPDDMPAHLRSVLTGVSLSIPVTGGRMALGTWQGIFLAEFRALPHRRTVAAHIIGA